MLEGLSHVKTLTPSLLCCFEINSDDYWSRLFHWPDLLFPCPRMSVNWFLVKGLLVSCSQVLGSRWLEQSVGS
jgi:hypothetical protein